MKGRDVRDLIRREVDAAEHERIRALWKKHSIAEDARDIPGLLSTLTEDCVYELVPEQRTWLGRFASGKPVLFRVVIFFPWDPVRQKFAGERIFTDPAVLIHPSRRSREVSYGAFDE